MFIAVFIKDGKRTCGSILSSVACLAVPYFSTLSHKQPDLEGGECIGNKMCFDFLYNIVQNSFCSEKYSGRQYHKCTKVFRCSCTAPILLSDYNDI